MPQPSQAFLPCGSRLIRATNGDQGSRDVRATIPSRVCLKGVTMITRRRFLAGGTLAGAGLIVLPRVAWPEMAQAARRIPMAARSIRQFVDELPALDVVVAGRNRIELTMTEFRAQVLPTGFPKTWVWGYLQRGQRARASYLGPVIVARRGTPTEIKWINDLGSSGSTNVRAWADATDQTVHWADPLNDEANACAESVEPAQAPTGFCAEHYEGPVVATPHLHGGEVPPLIDGGPDSWFSSDGAYAGHAYYSRDGRSPKNHAVYRYPNTQEAAPIWFHDHALGLTRLNVYAGLAGAYLITDPADPPPANLPAPIPLVVQDRMFDTNGQLSFPGGHPVHPQSRAPLLGPGVLRRHDRGQREGLALPRGRTEALPVPLPERLERPQLRDVLGRPCDEDRPVRRCGRSAPTEATSTNR